VQLLDMIFRKSDLLPRLEDQFHGFGVSGHLLFISCSEGLDFEVGQELLNLPVGEFAALNPSR